MLAKIYIHMGEPAKAAKYLKILENRVVRTDDDFLVRHVISCDNHYLLTVVQCSTTPQMHTYLTRE